MLKNFTAVILFLFLTALSVKSQDDPAYEKGKAVMKMAQTAIYQTTKWESIKSVYIKTEAISDSRIKTLIDGDTLPLETKLRQTIESNISLEMPGKVKQNVLTYEAGENPTENYARVESLINGEKYSRVTDTVIDGKVFDFAAIAAIPNLPDGLRKKIKEAQDKAKPTREQIEKDISNQLVTFLLNSLWENNQAYKYVGKAEAGETRADILEEDSKDERKRRYFFDEKTHLLLMITDEVSKNGLSSKTTHYFSDYQIIDGMMIAKKINSEAESSSDGQELEIAGQTTGANSKSKIVTETIVKDFKINSTFRPETFSIKEK